MQLFSVLCGAKQSKKSEMATHKPEILISQPVYNIAAQFQPQHLHVFKVEKFSEAISNTV